MKLRKEMSRLLRDTVQKGVKVGIAVVASHVVPWLVSRIGPQR